MIDINDYNKDDIIASCLIEAANVLSESANREESNLEKYMQKHGIKKPRDIHKTPIGFSEKEQKWYGWSHRAIYGLKVGDKCKPKDLGVGDGYTFKAGDTLKTLDDCKQRAIDFAKAVD